MIPVTGITGSPPAEIESRLYTGNILETLVSLDRAQNSDPNYAENFDAEFWALLCWNGSLQGYAREVSDACNAAVELDPGNVWQDNRGLNRALLGDYSGAISDFRIAVDNFKKNGWDSYYIESREGWIIALEAGENPFDAETIEMLKNE
jgi:hypothetical protein